MDLIRGAQDAMDRGDYAYAAAACSHAVEAYPSCFTAHRMLAESYLELGQTDAAVEHFERTLTIDPLNVVARLGLGVAAEEKREMSSAYASYLHAWEINPALDQVRDELVRLRGLLGGDERLHPTRAGLAAIFARGGQFGRAAAEWRAVMSVEPDNKRARTSLAEILWRSGDDLAAAATCRDALDEFPQNVRALAILAEIEQRRGGIAAKELIERYHDADPLGEIATLLADWREGVDVGFLLRDSAVLPEFDPSQVPAPAFSDAAGPAASPALGGQFAAPDLWDTLVKDFTDDLGSAPSTGASPDTSVQPFSWMDELGQAGSAGVEPFSLEPAAMPEAALPVDLQAALPPPAPNPAAGTVSLGDELAALGHATAPFAPQELPGAVPFDISELGDVAPFDLAGIGIDAEPAAPSIPPAPDPVLDPRPFGADAAPAPVPMPAAAATETATAVRDPFVTADGRVDLTVGWDDLDRQLREATPSFDNAAEVDALAAQLGVEGLEPFDMGEPLFDESAWAPFTDDDLGFSPDEPAASTTPATVPSPSSSGAGIDERAIDAWGLDDELVAAIPPQQSSGYTEMLRNVDSEFPPEIDAVPDEGIDPFVNPDTSGSPLVFEDLLAVTSRDGTAPLAAPAHLFEAEAAEPSWADVLPAETRAPETGPLAELDDADLPLDVAPFDLEALLQASASGEAAATPDWAQSVPAQDTDAGWDLPALALGDDARAWEPIASVEPAESAFAEPAAEVEPSWTPETTVDDAFLAVPAPAPMPEAADQGFDVLGLDAAFADLGDIQPFTIEEPELAAAAEADVVDFSDINDAPFDPESLSGVVLHEVPSSPVLPPADVEPLAAEADVLAGGPVVSPWEEIAAEPEPVAPMAAADVKRGTSGLGVAPGGVAWPSFVNHTSELIDRGSTAGNLFARLRDGKRSAVAAGLLTIDRSLVDIRTAEERAVRVVNVPVAPATAVEPAERESALTQDERLDLMAMRVRLIEDAESATEVAQVLEGAVARGLSDPLALRVLGEAYLKLGRTEQAAAQFRQAMLARRRAR